MRTAVALAVALAFAAAGRATAPACEKGWYPADVHLYGQRVESDVGGNMVLAQNETATDRRYVVARMCIRRVNETESDAQYYGRLTRPELLTTH